ncbi:MAG: hypothetical protein CM1200mP2_24000 [Planctomycetaceae bacterium]|nr:MAG: hypothetical protein CM1200mP2_24000 [Planctomycetaceae bacterium]
MKGWSGSPPTATGRPSCRRTVIPQVSGQLWGQTARMVSIVAMDGLNSPAEPPRLLLREAGGREYTKGVGLMLDSRVGALGGQRRDGPRENGMALKFTVESFLNLVRQSRLVDADRLEQLVATLPGPVAIRSRSLMPGRGRGADRMAGRQAAQGKAKGGFSWASTACNPCWAKAG